MTGHMTRELGLVAQHEKMWMKSEGKQTQEV